MLADVRRIAAALLVGVVALVSTRAQGPADVGRWSPTFNLWAMNPVPGSACLNTNNCPPWNATEPCGEIVHAVLISSGPKKGWVLYWRAGIYTTCSPGSLLQYVYIWNPETSTVWEIAAPLPPGGVLNDLFCAGHSYLGDGRLVIAGGQDYCAPVSPGVSGGTLGSVHVWLFDPAVLVGAVPPPGGWQPFTYLGAMLDRRWYPATATTPEGSVIIVGGGKGDCTTNNQNEPVFVCDPPSPTCPTPPIPCPNPGNWRMADSMAFVSLAGSTATLVPRLTDPSSGLRLELPGCDTLTTYPHVVPLLQSPAASPSAEFAIVAQEGTNALNTFSGGNNSWVLSLDSQTDIDPMPLSLHWRGSSNSVQVPFPGGPVDWFAQIGGNAQELGTAPGLATVEDLQSPSPTSLWQQSLPPLNQPRVYHNTLILPDGSLLVLEGATADYQLPPPPPQPWPAPVAVQTPERLVPGATAWVDMAPETDFRLYHCVAILLKDGRVLTMGGDWFPFYTQNPNPAGQFNFASDAQIYSPPYLFWGPRPVMDLPPAEIWAGVPFTLTVRTPPNESIGRIVLVRPGSVTHGVNFDQRYVSLAFQLTSTVGLPIDWRTQTFSITPPAHGRQAQPGNWMLFVLTGESPIHLQNKGIPSIGEFVRFRI